MFVALQSKQRGDPEPTEEDLDSCMLNRVKSDTQFPAVGVAIPHGEVLRIAGASRHPRLKTEPRFAEHVMKIKKSKSLKILSSQSKCSDPRRKLFGREEKGRSSQGLEERLVKRTKMQLTREGAEGDKKVK